MSTLSVSEVPLDSASPSQWLRRIAAAVRVQFTWWGVRRTLTNQQKEEVGDTYGAEAGFISASKKLIDTRHEAFRKLTAVRTRVCQYWRGLTLPYTEPGVRLIRQADIDGFVQVMEGFRDELLSAEADLNNVYQEIKADARKRLGRLYNADDYPPAIEDVFGVSWEFPSVEPPSYLMRLNPDLYQQEQRRVAQRFDEAVQLAEQAFVAEFAKLVSHLTERISTGVEGERKIFRDSAITNLSGFFERFRHLSVRSSQQLDQLVDQAKGLVQGIQPQDLRDNDRLRQQVATQLSQVQASLDGMMVDLPRRRIIRPDAALQGASHADPV